MLRELQRRVLRDQQRYVPPPLPAACLMIRSIVRLLLTASTSSVSHPARSVSLVTASRKILSTSPLRRRPSTV